MKNNYEKFSEKSIIQFHDDEGNVIDVRVLWMDRQNDFMFVIDINDKNSKPEKMVISEVEEKIINGKGQKITFEPFSALISTLIEQLTGGRKKRLETAWNIIKPLVLTPDGTINIDIFQTNVRRKLVSNRAKECKVTSITILSYLRNYMVGGMVKNALINSYDKCGGKGKERNYSSKPGRHKSDIDGTSKVVNNIRHGKGLL